jgi:FXSXX-COOH protein
MSDDIANGALFDVSGLNLSKLLEELDESSLATALDRIVASGEEGAEQHGFNSII